MATKKVPVKSVKAGHIIMDESGSPCKVVGVSTSKPGKHGAAKVRIDAVGLFDGRRRSILRPGSAEIEAPIIEKRKAQVVFVSGDNAQLMDLETYETFETVVPPEFKNQLESGKEVLYWKIAGKILIKQVQESQSS